MKKILLIEDDSTLRENTAELLGELKCKILTSPDGEDGINKARRELPDLIISDIMMPKIDGFGVFKTLQDNPATRRIPFIFLSVKAEPEDIRHGMNLGADDYITKPFKEQDLLAAVQSRLVKYEILNEKNNKASNGYFDQIQDLDALCEYFKLNGEPIKILKNDYLFETGMHASSLYLVEYGLFKTYTLDEDGKELITGFFKKGAYAGFYSFKKGSLYPESATALENSSAFRISIEEFEEILFSNQKLTKEFAQLLSDNLSLLRSHLLEMAYGSVLKKTTSTILEFAEKIQDSPEEAIRISRSDLASVAGISTESFIRSLSSLKKKGLIDIEGRHIKILNLKKLHQIK